MNTRLKVPGIYKIEIIPTGKVYIGQSKDLDMRIKKHKWAATTDSSYPNTRTPISMAMREYGLENVKFTILVSGPKYKDAYARTAAEIEWIAEYRSDDPEYGYNDSYGGEPGVFEGRPQSVLERNKRAKDVFLYNFLTGEVLLFYTGARGVAVHLNLGKDGKDVVSHAIKRGLKFLRTYYVMYANHDERHRQLDIIKGNMRIFPDSEARTISRVNNTFNQYQAAVKFIDKVAIEDFGFSK